MTELTDERLYGLTLSMVSASELSSIIGELLRWREAFAWLARRPGGRVGEFGPVEWYATFGFYPGKEIAVGTTVIGAVEALRKKVDG